MIIVEQENIIFLFRNHIDQKHWKANKNNINNVLKAYYKYGLK